MSTHTHEELPEEYPRNVVRERHHDEPPRVAPPPDEQDANGDGHVRHHRADDEERLHHRQAGNGAPHADEGPGHGDGHPDPEDARLIRPAEGEDLRRQWESIQASFIDEPREAVHEADRLVAQLTDRIAERFRAERSHLEERWGRGDEVSTEELRLTLQRYRSFFDRLLEL